MKTTRAYTIDQETLAILKKKENKSQYVCQSVKALHKKDVVFNLGDVQTKRILNSLLSRDISPALKALIELELWG